MRWNIAPECVSSVVLCIILVYSRRGTPIPSLKNRLFQACLFTTFCAMTSNIFSTLLIEAGDPTMLPLNWVVTLFYFIATPLMGLVYFSYVLASVYEDSRLALRRIFLFSIPGTLYAILILLTPLTRHIFSLAADGTYSQGPFILVTYVIFYFYCLLAVTAVLLKWRQVHPTLRTILITFPLLAGVVVVVQLALPDIILSGSAATCSLLIIYLFLQNKQSSLDHLTGIPNRQEFLKMLEYTTRKFSGKEFSVIVLSLRNFKMVNDSHGQHNGDALLAAVSDYLKRDLGLREHQLYRYSGDEFAIMLEAGRVSQAEALVEQLCLRMTHPWETPGCTCLLSCSVGVIHYPTSAATTAGLINGIESAVALAKNRNSPGNVCYCDSALLERVVRRQQITTFLKDAMTNDGFEVYYQPILEVSTGRFVIAEALLRLNNTPLGPIAPGEFIPIAEDCGLILDLTYVVLDKVCACIRRVLDSGLTLEGVNVNFSPVQFTQPDLVEQVNSIISRYGFPFSKIKVEITESTLAENPQVVADFMCRMHEYGIRIGLDDFGTGYSNLTSVTDLPLDVIKLDKSLIWSAMKNQRAAIVVQNLCRAFGELGMTVLAEGVETEAQSRFVTDCHCALIQGFLYARPMSEDQYFAFLHQHQNTAASLPHSNG